MRDVFTVSELNRYVKNLLDVDDSLFDLALSGEIANFVQNSRSGHCYFSLRDENAGVKAVMFQRDARRLAFSPEEGMRVVVRCRATLYERDGAFQIYVTDMFPDGIGSAQLALEQLKQKLYAEGLFAPQAKKPIPPQPRCIGVITSKTGAVLQDIRNVLTRRWPMVKVLLYPVSVQGVQASAQIAAALDTMASRADVDLIIVARGGGSREDLWVFNAECIARAAFRCPIPIISAIGHEIDTTILDLVADLRAPTPSAAAELAVPDQEEVRQCLYSLEENMQRIMQKRLALCYNSFADLALMLAEHPCQLLLKEKRFALDVVSDRLQKQAALLVQNKQEQLGHQAALAHSLNPYGVLSRGYTLLQNQKGTAVTSEQVKTGEHIRVVGHRTALRCLVESTEAINEEAKKL